MKKIEQIFISLNLIGIVIKLLSPNNLNLSYIFVISMYVLSFYYLFFPIASLNHYTHFKKERFKNLGTKNSFISIITGLLLFIGTQSILFGFMNWIGQYYLLNISNILNIVMLVVLIFLIINNSNNVLLYIGSMKRLLVVTIICLFLNYLPF